jgi:hypothetical protein
LKSLFLIIITILSERMEGLMAQMRQRGGRIPSGPKPLIEFKAGKMNFDGKVVRPDRRKGLLRVVQDAQGMRQL